MSDFEFVSVLLAIVAGLGITHLLSALAVMIEHRALRALDFIVLVWTVNVLGFHLIYWWVVVNNWRDVESWSFPQFALLFTYAVALYLCAALVLPRAADVNADRVARFERIRRPFFVSWLAVLLIELADSFSKGLEYVRSELGLQYLAIMGTCIGLTLVALTTPNRRFHSWFATGTGCLFAGWVGWRFFEI